LNTALAASVSIAFVVLALWHFWMALFPSTGASGAVPSDEGRPLFAPSTKATVTVGVMLLLFAGLVAATGRLVNLGIAPRILTGLSFALAAGLLARAIGEFRYVGFFKQVRGSRFATLDSLVYSPVCLLLALGVARVAQQNGF